MSSNETLQETYTYLQNRFHLQPDPEFGAPKPSDLAIEDMLRTMFSETHWKTAVMAAQLEENTSMSQSPDDIKTP